MWNLYAESPVALNGPGNIDFLAAAVFELEDGRAVWVQDDWSDTARNPFHVTEEAPVFDMVDQMWRTDNSEFSRLTDEKQLRLFHDGRHWLAPILEREGKSEREYLKGRVGFQFGPVRNNMLPGREVGPFYCKEIAGKDS